MRPDFETQIVGLVRHDVRVSRPNPGRCVHAGDILIIEAEAETLATDWPVIVLLGALIPVAAAWPL